MYRCSFCGWRYDPSKYVGRPGVKSDPFNRVPPHTRATNNVGEMSAATLESGPAEEELLCLGEDSYPVVVSC